MIDLPPLTPPVKRSVTIDGHRTSVSLEDAFWRALRAEATLRESSLGALVTAIDHARPPEIGLATAIRLFVLSRAQAAGRPGKD